MATLKDVAKEAGLTVSTVSRVLNNRGYISDEARKKVADAMKKLHYHPNEVARSLQNKRSHVIGVLVPHIQHPYFADVINYLEDAAYRRGYKMFLFNTMGREDKAREYLNLCNASRVEGIILCTGNLTQPAIESLSVPLVALERPITGCEASIVCDNLQGGVMAAERLIDTGCKNILYIGSIFDVEMPADLRASGFEQVCTERGVNHKIYRTEVGSYNSLRYYHLLEQIFDENPDVDGIFASSDIIAAEVLQVCNKRKITVPDQLKVVGFDDVIIATLTTPQLTTVHQPVQEMAEGALDLVCRAIEGEVVNEHLVLPVSMVERESC